MAKKEEFYKGIKVAGMVSFIPIVLAAGPLSGFLFGDYLTKTFRLPSYILYISIIIGFIASIRETVRIIKVVVKISGKS